MIALINQNEAFPSPGNTIRMISSMHPASQGAVAGVKRRRLLTLCRTPFNFVSDAF